METYILFDINYNFATYYRNKPSVLYKMLGDVFNADSVDLEYVTRLFEQIRREINVVMLNEFIKDSLKSNETYFVDENVHIITDENDEVVSKLYIYNDYIVVNSNNKTDKFIDILNDYFSKLYMINLKTEEFYWVKDLYNITLV